MDTNETYYLNYHLIGVVMNCVYLLIHQETNMIYVGSTSNPKERVRRHFRELAAGEHHCRPLQDDYTDETCLDVKYVIVETREMAYQLEQELLDHFSEQGILYNVGRHSRGGDNLTNNPRREAIIKRMAAGVISHYANMSPEERKVKYGRPGELNGMYGKTHTDEVRRKLSELNKGKVSPLRGIGWTEERKEAFKKVLTDRDYTGENNPFHGKTHSAETKAKLRESKLGSKPPNRRKVMVKGVLYDSLHDASKALGVPVATVLHRAKNTRPGFDEWQMVS